MKKIRLEIERLRVESFEAAPEKDGGRGTVRAREVTMRDEQTCDRTCGDSGIVMCDATFCDPSCVYHATCP